MPTNWTTPCLSMQAVLLRHRHRRLSRPLHAVLVLHMVRHLARHHPGVTLLHATLRRGAHGPTGHLRAGCELEPDEGGDKETGAWAISESAFAATRACFAVKFLSSFSVAPIKSLIK